MEALNQLREAAHAGQPVQLLQSGTPTESIRAATHAVFGGTPFALDEPTALTVDGERQPLRPVVFCWLHEKSLIVDYKQACEASGVADFKFLVKADVTAWLSGSLDLCKFLESPSGEHGADAETAAHEDPQMAQIARYEVELLDHNAVLRGTKNVALKTLVLDGRRFAAQLKKARPARAPRLDAAKKQPIIIVSPATTALLSLSNIKEFLENGHFVEPALQRSDSNVVTIHRPLDKLAAPAQNIMVVDNVDLFTRPEYWDRVVAIFTTGQTWQFAKFKDPRPETLFQNYAGFYMGYTGDIVPRHISDWNVQVVQVDREKRFRDKMIVRDFWVALDKILLAKGYGA